MLSQTQAMLISLGLEVPCLLGLGLARRWMPRSHAPAWAIAAVAATLLTHPFAWDFSITHTPGLTPEGKALRIEAAVVLAESLIYTVGLRLPPSRGFALALLANAVSFGVGLLL
ncbi:MAG: hypothetical protein ACRBN8_35460 [Nannocystales bacterium]